MLYVIDPVSVFEQCLADQQRLNTLQDIELENTKLRETLDDYNKEFANVKNQGICNVIIMYSNSNLNTLNNLNNLNNLDNIDSLNLVL